MRYIVNNQHVWEEQDLIKCRRSNSSRSWFQSTFLCESISDFGDRCAIVVLMQSTKWWPPRLPLRSSDPCGDPIVRRICCVCFDTTNQMSQSRLVAMNESRSRGLYAMTFFTLSRSRHNVRTAYLAAETISTLTCPIVGSTLVSSTCRLLWARSYHWDTI